MKKLIKRLQTGILDKFLKKFPIVAVVGARQVGKTTLVRDILKEKRKFVTFDEPVNIMLAEQDADSFLNQAGRLTIDEIQKVPSLFPAIKRFVDKSRKPGQFLITGSANITMLARISESLAGRVAFIEMSPFTVIESSHSQLRKTKMIEIISTAGSKKCWQILCDINPKSVSIEKYTFRGGLPPAFFENNNRMRQEWFKGYVRTYLERDVRDLSKIQKLYEYQKFLSLLAFRSAQIFNKSEVARDCGIPYTTAGHFFDLLLATYQVFTVQPYYRNIGKRLIKAPKLMWNDTGLAMFLQGLNTWEDACRLGRNSFLVENKIAIELKTLLSVYESSAKLFYWRTSGGAEIDFVIERRGQLIPIEVKWRNTVKPKDLVSMQIFLKDFKDSSPWGMILYKGKNLLKVKENIFLVPFNYFLQ